MRKLEHNVDRYSRTPAAGMVVLGAAGEADGLTDSEARAVLETAIAVAANEKVMLAGISRASVFATLELAQAAARSAYDAVVLHAPAGLTGLERRTYFEAVADRSDLPVMLVSDGSRELDIDTVTRLAGHPNVLGIIEGDAERVAPVREVTAAVSRIVTVTNVFAAVTARMLKERAPAERGTFVSAETLGGKGAALAVTPATPQIRTRTKRVGFQVLAARTPRMLQAWQSGAAGSVPRLGACSPQGCCEVWQAFKDGDLGLAEEKQQRLLAAASWTEGPRGIAAMKHGCDWNGYFGGRPRLPLLGLTAEERASLEQTLASLRN